MKNSRHERDCRVCRHPQREEIEVEFCEWTPPAKIARTYRLGSRASLYRHARACGLIPKRDRNLRAALANVIERGSRARISGTTVVQAIVALSRINGAGQWVNRSETVDLNELFSRMSRDEMLAYAETGSLPPWFEHTIGGRPLLPATGESESIG